MTTHADRRPVLNSASVVLWRSPGVLQLELGNRRIVIDDVRPEQVSALLAQPDGRRAGRPPRAGRTRASPNRVEPTNTGQGDADHSDGEHTSGDHSDGEHTSGEHPAAGREAALAELTRALAAAGFITDSTAADRSLAGRLPAQFGPDYGALVARHGDAAASVLAGRRRAAVAVHGNSRITTTIASTLASAGIGWVQLVHGGEVSAGEACPGGLTPADEGSRFAVAGAQAVQRCSPTVRTSPLPAGRRADLVILTDPLPVEPAVRAGLHLDGVAHLPAGVDGSHAVVGPLVLPGVTSCLRCADLHRCERDPAWPVLAVQLAARPRRRATSDVTLCIATAGLTAGQALAYLDGDRPETLNASLEWQLPDWRLRRRRWISHHDCDCGAAIRAARDGRMGW
jgi:hypothetical protein